MQKGGVISDTLEAIKDLTADTGKAVIREPLEILQNALGGDVAAESPEPLEQGAGTQAQGAAAKPKSGISDHQLVAKKIDDQDRVQKLLALHRQRLKEEEVDFEQSEEKAKQEKERAKQEEEAKRQEEIVQLQRQEAKDAVLSAPSAAKGSSVPGAVKQTQKLKGTKELGKTMGD